MGIALKHLSETERKAIAGELFKVTSTEDQKGELHGLCPIHQEKNPSFSYNYKKDVYHCLSCGVDGDLLRLWSEVNGHGQKEGYKAFCAKFGINPGKGNKGTGEKRGAKGGGGEPAGDELSYSQVMEQMLRAWELFPPLPEEWLARMEKSRGWSREIISTLDLRLQTHYLDKKGILIPVKKPERVAIPIKDILGRLINIRLYRPGGGQMKIISWARSTGASALFPAQPLFIDKPVLLCEGEPDTICALSHGFNAITQTSKLKKWPELHLMHFKGKDVLIAYDADVPGQKYAGFAAQALTGAVKSVRMIQWPSFMGIDENGAYPGDHGQDLTDFFVTHGKTPADLQALIDSAFASPGDSPPPLSPDPASPDILQFFDFGLNKRFSFKPRLLAEKIAADSRLLSDPGTGLVYRWNDRYWEEFDEDHLKNAAVRYLGNEAQKSRVEDAVYQVKMLATISHGRAVNDREEWINLQNGMLNIYTFEMRPHDPEFYFINILPVTFDPASQKRCERFEQYLRTNIVTLEVIAQLQEFTGYCLVRHANYEKCIFLLGPGADGKSRYMKILRALVGPENCSAVSFGDIEDHFQRSALYNKMVNLSAEVGSNMIESEYFKKITSGDTINAAFKHKDAFDFNPYCKLVFAGNILPRVRDNSDGFFRRILPIQFKRQFKEDDPERDPWLLDKFKAEISEIFFWALCGLKRLMEQQRFTDCEETRNLLMGYRRSNNPILCFVEDECSLDDEYEVSKADLYNAYRKYCGDNGYVPVSRETFFRELYAAIHNLRLYRPRMDGERISIVQGIKVNFKVGD